MTKYAKWLFGGPHFTFLTGLKYSECLFRLKNNIDKPSKLSIVLGDTMFGKSEFVGDINDSSFLFHKKCFRKGSKPLFCGKLFDVKKGTIIEGSFQTDSVAKAFGVAFISLLFLLLLPFLVGLIIDLKNDPNLILGILLISFVLAGVSVFVIFGKATKKGDEVSYTKFLIELLEAELVERKD